MSPVRLLRLPQVTARDPRCRVDGTVMAHYPRRYWEHDQSLARLISTTM